MLYFGQDAVAYRIEITGDVRANKMWYSHLFRGIVWCHENHRVYYNISMIFS